MTQTQTSFRQAFPDLKPVFDYPLAPRTYFKIGGPAEIYFESSDASEISKLIQWCHAQSTKLTILGGASNVIVADEGIKGLVLHIADSSVAITDIPGSDQKILRVGAGIKTALLVSQAVAAGMKGLEYFLGVPGTLGGAVYNNAHYLSHLISQHIGRVLVIDQQGKSTWLKHEECDFSYDHSRFQSTHEVILQVEFWLSPGIAAESQALIKEATLYRAQTQPLGMPSSGCIFQNVPNTRHLQELFPKFAEKSHVPGGFLIDQAGLKGAKIGGIEVSQKHAAFFVNHGSGTAQEVRELVGQVKRGVKQKFGVDLHEEVFYLR